MSFTSGCGHHSRGLVGANGVLHVQAEMEFSANRRSTNQDADNSATIKDDDPSLMKKRSVVIAGHRTSVSLENAFWVALKEIATRKDLTVNQLVTGIDRQRAGNLSSAIRVYILQIIRAA